MSRVASMGQISKINDHLYLSGASVLRPDRLRQKGITTVVNATVEEPSFYATGVDCLKIRVEDHPQELLSIYFDIVADKIKMTAENGGRTLVHCVAGVSRSPSLCIAYLIKYERMTLRQAYRMVKTCRPIVRPNLGFWKQLIDYERRFLGKNTVRMVPSAHNSDLYLPEVYVEEQQLGRLVPTTGTSTASVRSVPAFVQFSSAKQSPVAGMQKRFVRRQTAPDAGHSFVTNKQRSFATRGASTSSSVSALAMVSAPLKSRMKMNLFQSVYGSQGPLDSPFSSLL